MLATTRALVSVEEYLSTVYESDCDYVDGEVVERNLGESAHSELQLELAAWLASEAKRHRFRGFTEQRVQTLPRHFRIPDLCVVLGRVRVPPILRQPPFLCIEIMSSEDRLSRMLKRLDEYIAFGVPFNWLIDPFEKAGYSYSRSGLQLAEDGLLRTTQPDLVLDLNERFRAIEEE